jgi:acetolactate synthase-1/2/3 large subunit
VSSVSVPVYEALALQLKAWGVERVFGLMSDDTAAFVATIDAVGIRFVSARHENNAVAMAEGYAAATNQVGVVIIGRGPATTNAMNGVNYANKSGSPVLMIFGDSPNAQKAPNAVGPDRKHIDAQAILAGAGLSTFKPTSAGSAVDMFRQAYQQSLQGACAYLIPANVQKAIVDFEAETHNLSALGKAQGAARAAAIATAVEHLKKAKAPLFVLGQGVHKSGAEDAVIALGDKLGAAFVSTLKAKDVAKGHPYDLGLLGSFSNAGGRRLIEQADCVVAIGASMNQQTTSWEAALPSDVPVLQIDSVRTNIGRWYHADVALVGDVAAVVDQLSQQLDERPAADMVMRNRVNTEWLQSFTLDQDFQSIATPRTLDSRELSLALDVLLPANRNLVWDSGNMLGNVPYLSVTHPSHFKHTGDSASIGMGFGVALGFAVGQPQHPTVLLLGDGSLLMTLGELETVVREDIPLVIVLMNDCAYGAELHFLAQNNMSPDLSQFPDIDYAPIAESFGFYAATIRTLEDLKSHSEMLANPEYPIFLDCKINASFVAPFLLESLQVAKPK